MRMDGCLDLWQGGAPFPTLRQPVVGAKAWHGAEVDPAEWIVPLSGEAMAEIDAVLDTLRAQALPVYLLHPDQFELPACRALMARVRDLLDAGKGLALVDRLPLERISRAEAKAAYWLLGRLLAQPVAQNARGMIFRDIVDQGSGQASGDARAVTNRLLDFHTDNSGNIAIPDYIGLLCHQPAAEGGLSRFCSVATLHNTMLACCPRLLERLYQPFYHDRQGIQEPGGPEVLVAPALCWDGERLAGRFSTNKIGGGYEKMGEALDPVGREALDTVVRLAIEAGLSSVQAIERGQIQFLDNRALLHYRTNFRDDPDPERRRHLLRLWFRREGRPFFNG